MDMYWITEYVKVGAGYMFLMFLWPSVVFWDYLKKKSWIFRFAFCVTVQIMIVNTIVLMTGLFHFLNETIVCVFFYGIFLIAVWKMKNKWKTGVLKKVTNYRRNTCSHIGEYVLLSIVIIYGVIYFSYGSFQIHSYGQYDTMIHHGWVNKMVRGQIFPEGIYPSSMHCFIYCMNALFRIKIYNIMLFLQCFHVAVFFLSAYCLMREIFRWRYTPILVLGLYFTMDFTVSSVARLQSTLPMEFGLHTQFLCALYLIKYLKKEEYDDKKGYLKGAWNENLVLFAAALSTSIATHYYTTIMAFVVCVSFAVFSIRKIFRYECLLPLMTSVICGCFIAVIPMAAAFIAGTPFEASIYWGLNMLNGSEEQAEPEFEEGKKLSSGPFELTDEDASVIDKLPESGQKIIGGVIKTEYLVREIYKKGYKIIYGEVRGRRIFKIMAVVIFFCIINRLWCKKTRYICSDYPPLILVSFLSTLIFIAYNSPELGLSVLIPNHRFAPSGHLATLAVMLMPADIMFSFGTKVCSDKVLQLISIISVGGIYLLMKILGIFHGYLYFTLMRYEAAVFVTDSVIEEFVQDSFTIVSPNDEAPQIELYGRHQEISEFIANCEGEFYSIPTEYVFIYIEKRPIEYCQRFYFSGPSWLANSGNSEIKATRISKESAYEDMSKYANASWSLYMDGRTILESKAYEWCRRFEQKHPMEMKTYYEDDDFVCYYFKQDPEKPYNLAGEQDEDNFVCD